MVESNPLEPESGGGRLSGGAEQFCREEGSVLFTGVTHQLVDESKLESSPFKKGTGSFHWVWAPIELILSLLVPNIFLGAAIARFFGNEILSQIVASCCADIIFYIELLTFLLVTEYVQKPHLQLSRRRSGRINALRFYMMSSFWMSLNVRKLPLAVYDKLAVFGWPALVSWTAILVSYMAQLLIELYLLGSSCWPLLPIVFEVYRLYQLTKASHFLETLMFAIRGVPLSPEVQINVDSMVLHMGVTFQVFGLMCIGSMLTYTMLTFIPKLIRSRAVAENY